ncbi:RCC1 domain-containing protein [Undibacterium crateris]|uniref:RCC1 domain-containing protein n=1 Tax=Undibacterium crateris TaxID=2528175 RepID=UPI001389713B|nr:hypothetical protein [Undibacterium crateris]NDI87210.1 hypothetical protein [Undibacterium crateris]
MRHYKSILLTSTVGMLVAGCGGDSQLSEVLAQAKPEVSIDVFGARGSTLTAVVNASNCASAPTVSWATAGGVKLGSGLSIQDTQPDAAVVATASCSDVSASQTLAANSVFSSAAAFAVLKSGSPIAWGNPVWGAGGTLSASITNVTQLYPSERGFAAILPDATVKAWGSSFVGIADPKLAYPATGAIATDPLTDVAAIIPGKVAYFAVKKDGTVAAWGRARGMKDADVMMVNQSFGFSPAVKAAMKDVLTIVSNEGSYAALKKDGTVVTFGKQSTGGDSSYVKAILKDVTQIVGGNYDFLALRKDGTVVNWGYGYGHSGDDQSVPVPEVTGGAKLFMNGYTGVAIDGKKAATAFGYAAEVDSADAGSVAKLLVNVAQVYSTNTAFAALKEDGSVVAWGDAIRMNDSLNKVQSSLVNVKSIVNSEYAFAALKQDGSVVTWGDPQNGGDSSAVAARLTNVVAITANKFAFAALKSDGTVVTWGMGSKGGDSADVAAKLINIRAIYATPYGAFLAVAKDGSYVTWGDAWAGGDSSSIIANLTKIPFSN